MLEKCQFILPQKTICDGYMIKRRSLLNPYWNMLTVAYNIYGEADLKQG